eukprot:4536876-Prymnesium_polylepis.1
MQQLLLLAQRALELGCRGGQRGRESRKAVAAPPDAVAGAAGGAAGAGAAKQNPAGIAAGAAAGVA